MNILSLISLLVSVYTLLLFVRVILTWVPSMEYSKFGRFLAEICDPFLNIFKKVRFLRAGNIDFTPMLAIGSLVIVSSVLQSIINSRRISVGVIIASVINLCWSVISTVFVVFIVVVLIRLIVNFLNKDTDSQIWVQLDKMISPVAYHLSNMIFPKKYIKYQTVLIVTLIALVVCYFLLEFILLFIAGFFASLPF
ncbi:MAG: YggT family protein [Treponemataceae bacterium]|nr:YggT family protein [Treponemataceae bacterium]